MNTTTNEALLKKIDEAPLLMSKEAAKKKLRKPRSIYGDQILFMLAITVIATCFYGMRVVAVCACSVLAYRVSELLALEVLPLVASGLTLLALFVWSATALGTVRGIRTGAIFAPAH